MGSESAARVAVLLCDPRRGIGSDGLLLGPLASDTADFGLRIFNPDGSEAEKSGNGLRIFVRYLRDRGLVGTQPFQVETRGGVVRARIDERGERIEVWMGRACFGSGVLGLPGPEREVVLESLRAAGEDLRFCGVSVGNPHCVVVDGPKGEAAALRLGPVIERDARFPNRTNVQFLEVVDRHTISIEIWERGAGRTLASGSSATAAACVARKLGRCESPVQVQMPGGSLDIFIDEAFDTRMVGPAVTIARGRLARDVFA